MKFTTLLVLGASLLSFSACEHAALRSDKSEIASQSQLKENEQLLRSQDSIKKEFGSAQPVSLKDADAANIASQALERKIIRNAALTVEVTSPGDSQHKIVSIAESHQGFVVTSEATQRASEDRTKPEMTVTLSVRVPAAQFNQVMDEIRAVGARVIQEKVTGQDVTEEFMDLEARIKNQKALELQFLEIMKRAGKVDDALSVQRQLAEVRTEIEKLEGRRRFLENQSSLSTINVTLQPPTQIVNATGFWYSARSAFSDGVDVAAGIVLFLIRAIIGLLPIMVLIVLPSALLLKLGLRVVRRRRAVAEPATAAVSE
ncbi:MAG TPA: DUF4349 domain-containing protein [Pyrinomonadaceae bacterium]|jgi:hypothetical protein